MPHPDRIVAAARAWIGTPYRHQASLKGVGCDCLGLLRGVWREIVGDEPERPPPYGPGGAGSDALAEAARRWLLAREPGAVGAGDVLLFRWRDGLPARHCAIATAAGTMVHAHSGANVAEVALSPWWRRHLAHAFRFPDG
ncbi:MAG TPA: peptidase P60 [Microvirga sp.]|jgi:NlpC/P60 family putative phage cell wall peptidase|nr:peptidase P60 [Microvirga sp.]